MKNILVQNAQGAYAEVTQAFFNGLLADVIGALLTKPDVRPGTVKDTLLYKEARLSVAVKTKDYSGGWNAVHLSCTFPDIKVSKVQMASKYMILTSQQQETYQKTASMSGYGYYQRLLTEWHDTVSLSAESGESSDALYEDIKVVYDKYIKSRDKSKKGLERRKLNLQKKADAENETVERKYACIGLKIPKLVPVVEAVG